jgi:hypothetical protein
VIEEPKYVTAKKIEVVVIRGKKRITKIYRPEKNRLFTRASSTALLDKIAEQLEKAVPYEEFRLVALGPFKFNIISITCEKAAEVQARHVQ